VTWHRVTWATLKPFLTTPIRPIHKTKGGTRGWRLLGDGRETPNSRCPGNLAKPAGRQSLMVNSYIKYVRNGFDELINNRTSSASNDLV
jgi:hypothetical protein